MTKEEIIEAINATVAPNNVKGITAESLANILIEIVNSSGESGGGSGMLSVFLGQPDNDYLNVTQTAEQKIHNASVFRVVKDATIMPPISIDMSGLYSMDVGMSSVKASVPSAICLYVPAEITGAEGINDGAVFISSDAFGDLLLTSDGTLAVYTEESNS